jgi:hypothetical protein
MRYVFIITTILTLAFSSLNASTWSFTEKDLTTMNDEQKKVLEAAIKIGEYYGLGDILVKIAAVETRFGKITSKSKSICGAMQIAKRYHKVSCKLLKDNIYLSMNIAAKEMLRWLKKTNGDVELALMHYNRGYLVSDHDHEYIRRINAVKTIIKTVDIASYIKRSTDVG